jgi:hypothetical protein
MVDFMKDQIKQLDRFKCRSNDNDCYEKRYLIIDKIEDMLQYLNEINRIENRLADLDNNLNNNEDILKIMKKESKGGDHELNDKTNYVSIENYQLDELNNNKNIIDKNIDLYLTQLKKLFYIICALIFVYFILISFTPPVQ